MFNIFNYIKEKKKSKKQENKKQNKKIKKILKNSITLSFPSPKIFLLQKSLVKQIKGLKRNKTPKFQVVICKIKDFFCIISFTLQKGFGSMQSDLFPLFKS